MTAEPWLKSVPTLGNVVTASSLSARSCAASNPGRSCAVDKGDSDLCLCGHYRGSHFAGKYFCQVCYGMTDKEHLKADLEGKLCRCPQFMISDGN